MVESFQVALDCTTTIPSHNWRWDFVSDGIAENRGMPRTGPHTCPDTLFNAPCTRLILQEGNVLLPREPHHDAELMPVCQIQQPARWNGVSAKRIEAVGSNLTEVWLGCRGVRVAITV